MAKFIRNKLLQKLSVLGNLFSNLFLLKRLTCNQIPYQFFRALPFKKHSPPCPALQSPDGNSDEPEIKQLAKRENKQTEIPHATGFSRAIQPPAFVCHAESRRSSDSRRKQNTPLLSYRDVIPHGVRDCDIPYLGILLSLTCLMHSLLVLRSLLHDCWLLLGSFKRETILLTKGQMFSNCFSTNNRKKIDGININFFILKERHKHLFQKRTFKFSPKASATLHAHRKQVSCKVHWPCT